MSAVRPTPLSFWFRRLLLIVAGLAAPAALPAAELHLRNGDRVTGDLIGRSDNRIYFRSPILGDITVPETEVAVVETPETPPESLVGLPPQDARPKPPVGSARSPAAQTAQATPAKNPTAPGKPPAASLAPARKPWKGKVEVGLQQQSGRTDTSNLSLRAEAERTQGRDNYRGSGRLLYGEQNGIRNNDRSDASFRWRHDLSDRVFSQTITSYSRDKIKQIELNLEQNAGLGYHFLQLDRHVLTAGIGGTGQYREAFAVENGFTALAEMFQDYSYKISNRLTLVQDSRVQYSPDESKGFTLVNNNIVATNRENTNYKLRFNTTLQGKMSERVSLNLRFEYEYDNTVLNRSATTDQRITSSLGYAF